MKDIGEKRAELGVEGPGCEESWSRRPTFPSYTVTHNNILDDGIKGPDLGPELDGWVLFFLPIDLFLGSSSFG